jgi:O-antigen ligase
VQTIIRFGLYLILLTPLLAHSGFLMPHLTPKVLAFQVLVEIVTAGALVSWLGGTKPAARWKKSYPLNSPIIVSLGCFLIYALVASWFGIDATGSFWGILERQDGIFLLIHFFAWLVILGWLFRMRTFGKESTAGLDWRSYFSFSFWISVAAAFSAILEWYVFQKWETTLGLLVSMKTGRAGGLFGNPLFGGPYFSLHMFYGLVYARDVLARRPVAAGAWSRIRTALVLLAIFAGETAMLGGILVGKTRGVLWGLVAGFVALAIASVVVRSLARGFRIAVLAGFAAAVALGAFVWFARDSAFAKNNGLLTRMTQLSAADTAQMRLLAWRSALNGFRDHPVFGWGHDSMYYVLNRHYNPEHVRFDPTFESLDNTWYDKSHNAYIDILAEEGVIGALLFLAVIAAIGFGLRKMKDKLAACCTAAGLVAYGGSNLVGFDSFGSLFAVTLFLSAILVDGSPPAVAVEAKRKGGKDRGEETKLPVAARAAAAAGLVAIAAALYLNAQIAQANAGYAEARAVFESDPTHAISLYRSAFEHYSPYAGREKLKCAYATVNVAIAHKQDLRSSGIAEFALGLAREAVAANPQDAQAYIRLNDICNGFAIYMDKRFLADAQAAGERGLALSPLRQEAMMTLGRTYLLADHPIAAIELGRRMVSGYPELPVAHWFLGLSLLQAKQRDEAKKEMGIAMRTGYRFQNATEEQTIKQLLSDQEFRELTGN